MKSHWKNSLKLYLIISTVFLVGCGKKENKVNSATLGLWGSTPFSASNPALASNPQIVNQVNSIKTNVACQNGYRLRQDYSFFLPTSQGGTGSRTTIGGQFQEGFRSNGSITQLYIGVSLYRDLMFVTKLTNGAQVLGFNVTLSFCEMKNSYQGLPSIISNERQLRGFQAPSGINLDTDTNCGYGVVDWAPNTVITSLRQPGNQYSPPDVQVPTSYTKPLCNGQF